MNTNISRRLLFLFIVSWLLIFVQHTIGATFTVTNRNDQGPGSLRQAIIDANRSGGVIGFNIPGPGPYTIRPMAALPDITATVYIDATTQPGFAGTPIIELDGSMAGAVSGLTIRANGRGSTIRGLVVNRFRNHGILLDADENKIVGNFIGVDVKGSIDLGNGGYGLVINNRSFNMIGDDITPSKRNINRNIISGNDGGGVSITGNAASGNRVFGNFIGTDVTGTNPLGNNGDGAHIADGPQNNKIARNIISANKTGVHIEGQVLSSLPTKYNQVVGNYSGVYFYTFQSGSFTASRKMVIIK